MRLPNFLPHATLAFILFCGIAHAQQPSFDFESGDLQGWKVVEGAFDRLVCDRDTFHNGGQPYNKQGEFYLGSLETSAYTPNDGFQGVVQSPTFVLESDRLSLLVGGGAGPGVHVALCTADEDEEVRAARGTNDETMVRRIWDTAEFVGRQVYLKLVDHETGGWGHVTADDIRVPTRDELAALPIDASVPGTSQDVAASLEGCTKRVSSLQAAIEDLRETYGAEYPRAEEFLGRAQQMGERLAGIAKPRLAQKLRDFAKDLDALGREVFVSSPLLSRTPILFVMRNQYKRDHHNTETMFINGQFHGGFDGGGALRVLDVATGKATVLLDAPFGIVRDPEVSYDGKRILFAYRKDAADDYHIWELNADGSGLRQLTTGWGIADIDPIYLPAGDIIFSSTRDPKVCACNVHAQANLFRMGPNGETMRQLGRNTLFEGHAQMMPDGRVLYSRWEYVDKHFGPAQGLWTMNPDGTYHVTYYHNNTWWPGGILDGHAIPGTDQVIATLTSCHAPPFGEVAILDRRIGFEGVEPMVRSWPQVPVTRGDYDYVWGLSLRYEDPYPLVSRGAGVPAADADAKRLQRPPSQGTGPATVGGGRRGSRPLDDADTRDSGGGGHYFLCSRTIAHAEDRYGIFLIDTFGNEVLIHADEERSCFDPMPLAAHPAPPAIPDRVDYAQAEEGTFFVSDVYRGTGMESVQPGAIKWLRVVESPPKRFVSNGDWNNGARQAPAMNWSDVVNKRIIGTVPVEADGSAHFKAPADRFLFFQLLDENGMMIQSMRSGAILQPGETASCVGCHEERNTAIPARRHALALQREPSGPAPWYGPERDFDYCAEVQPVLDRYCIRCHDYGDVAAERVNLSGDKTLFFNTSYLDLHRKSGVSFSIGKPEDAKPFIKVVNHGPPEVLPAYSWGSHRSRLIEVLLEGHHGLAARPIAPVDGTPAPRVMEPEDFARLVTWVDLNAVYYGSFACVTPDNPGGRSPLTGQQVARLNELCGVNVADEIGATWVSFTRPELSPCLGRLPGPGDAKYDEALAIITAGAEALRQHPRADMPGSVPYDACLKVDELTHQRIAAETSARESLARGH